MKEHYTVNVSQANRLVLEGNRGHSRPVSLIVRKGEQRQYQSEEERHREKGGEKKGQAF